MGIGIPKNIAPLDLYLKTKTTFVKKQADFMNKCLCIWKIDEHNTKYLEWPYKFEASAAYIILVISTPTIDSRPLL